MTWSPYWPFWITLFVVAWVVASFFTVINQWIRLSELRSKLRRMQHAFFQLRTKVEKEQRAPGPDSKTFLAWTAQEITRQLFNDNEL